MKSLNSEIQEEFQSVAFQGRVRNTIYDMSSGGLMQMDIFYTKKCMTGTLYRI